MKKSRNYKRYYRKSNRRIPRTPKYPVVFNWINLPPIEDMVESVEKANLCILMMMKNEEKILTTEQQDKCDQLSAKYL